MYSIDVHILQSEKKCKEIDSDAYNSVDGKHFERKEKRYSTRNDVPKKICERSRSIFQKNPIE